MRPCLSQSFRFLVVVLTTVVTTACINLPEEVDLLAVGTEFVVRGTTVVLDSSRPCLAWEAENGITYHLFQSTRLDNESYDQIMVPGVTSRLVIATRTDLELDCATGTLVEVRDVLEIVE